MTVSALTDPEIRKVTIADLTSWDHGGTSPQNLE